MISINFVALLGTIRGEVRHNTTQNSQVANFTLVTKAKAHPNAKVDFFQTFHNITAWGRLAEIVKDCAEGDAVEITGAIETESWEQDGMKRYKTIIKAKNLNLFDVDPERPQPSEAPDAPF